MLGPEPVQSQCCRNVGGHGGGGGRKGEGQVGVRDAGTGMELGWGTDRLDWPLSPERRRGKRKRPAFPAAVFSKVGNRSWYSEGSSLGKLREQLVTTPWSQDRVPAIDGFSELVTEALLTQWALGIVRTSDRNWIHEFPRAAAVLFGPCSWGPRLLNGARN